jgi:hypothetical protein
MRYVFTVVILLLAVTVAAGLYLTTPETKKVIPQRPVPLVETIPLEPGTEKIFIEAFGTVVPAQRITLQPEVGGRIIYQNQELIPGGLIEQDKLILQIDSTDYKLQVSAREAELVEALVELELENGRQVIAKREWELLEKEIATSGAGKSLALREPHLKRIKARIAAAKDRLAAAKLAEKRTTLLSPFNALVLEEFVDTGQLVDRQTPLATLVGTDQFWVQVSVPVSHLQRISFPEWAGQRGSTVRVIFDPESGAQVIRQGRVLRMLGDLDPKGRMARILVAINDPLKLRGREKKRKERVPQPDIVSNQNISSHSDKILLGSYVKVEIDAGILDDVYVIPRAALREGNRVWIHDRQQQLQFRRVRIIWRRQDDLLVTGEFQSHDRLIVSRLQSPLPGMTVRSNPVQLPANKSQ